MRKISEVDLAIIMGQSTLKKLKKDLKPSNKYQFIDISEEFYLLFRYNGQDLEELIIFDTEEEMNNYVLTKFEQSE